LTLTCEQRKINVVIGEDEGVMMTGPEERKYMFLDDEADRKQFIALMDETRDAVWEVVHNTPENQWYEPRYHGWSLAAMLGHMNLTDNFGMLQIKLGLRGITIPISPNFWDSLNNLTANLFRKRLVQASIDGMKKNQPRIAAFLMEIPVNKFTQRVFYPPQNKYLTVEQAVQTYFLFHWQDHLQTLRAGGEMQTESADNGEWE